MVETLKGSILNESIAQIYLEVKMTETLWFFFTRTYFICSDEEKGGKKIKQEKNSKAKLIRIHIDAVYFSIWNSPCGIWVGN